MRKITLAEINKRVQTKARSVDYAVNKLRSKTRDEGWTMGRVRPHDHDEVLALNRLSRLKFRTALKSGKIHYDK